jgi:hypothetical protein
LRVRGKPLVKAPAKGKPGALWHMFEYSRETRETDRLACLPFVMMCFKRFLCFLLGPDFIGLVYQDERKILLRNLSGSSAYKQDLVNASDLFDSKLIPQT